jgi:hypothetical protein
MTRISIAEAIREVAQIKGKVKEWSGRLQGVFYRDDDPPAFKFDKSREKLNELIKRLVELQTAIAIANASTSFEWGSRTVSLAMAVRTLSELKGTIKRLEELPVRTSKEGVDTLQDVSYDDNGRRYVEKTSRPWTSDMSTAEQVELLESLREKYVKLNNAVETVNHKTLIVEVEGLPDASM